MMIPLCIEVVRCLEEGIVASPAEADMALIYGIGFPPFRGGACYYLDQLGLNNFCKMTEKYHHLGGLYQPTEKMLAMAASGETYYPNAANPGAVVDPQGRVQGISGLRVVDAPIMPVVTNGSFFC